MQLEDEIREMTEQWRKCKKEATRMKEVRTRGGIVLSPETVGKIKEMRRLGRRRRDPNLTEGGREYKKRPQSSKKGGEKGGGEGRTKRSADPSKKLGRNE